MSAATQNNYIYGFFESVMALPQELKKRTIDMTETIGEKIDAFGRAFRGDDQDNNDGDIFTMLSQHHAFIENVRKTNPVLYCVLINAAACWKSATYNPMDTLKCGAMAPALTCSQFASKDAVLTFVVNVILVHQQVEKQDKTFVPSTPLLTDILQKSTIMSPEEVTTWVAANMV